MLSCSNSQIINCYSLCPHPQALDKLTQAFPVSHLSSSFLFPVTILSVLLQCITSFPELLFELCPLCVCVSVPALCGMTFPCLHPHILLLMSHCSVLPILCVCARSPRNIPGWIIYSQVNRMASLRILWKFCLPGTLQSYSQNLHHCSDITFSFQISGLLVFVLCGVFCLFVLLYNSIGL